MIRMPGSSACPCPCAMRSPTARSTNTSRSCLRGHPGIVVPRSAATRNLLLAPYEKQIPRVARNDYIRDALEVSAQRVIREQGRAEQQHRAALMRRGQRNRHPEQQRGDTERDLQREHAEEQVE